MQTNKINWGTLVIGVVIGAIAMWGLSFYVKSAKGAVTTTTSVGVVTSINKSYQQGSIKAPGVAQEYQFRIPEDVQTGYAPVVGNAVTFDVTPDQAQRARNVRLGGDLCNLPNTCSDEIDNDGDGTVDLTDPQCQLVDSTSECGNGGGQ